MPENELTLAYGCPKCSRLYRKTGAFKDIIKTKRSFIKSMLYFLRMASTLTVEVIEKEPVEEYYYRSITIPVGHPEVDELGHTVQICRSSRPCPYCGIGKEFTVSRNLETGVIHWCVGFGGRDVNVYFIQRCEKCGEEYSKYVFYEKYDEIAECRNPNCQR
jgi:hypothetical protein